MLHADDLDRSLTRPIRVEAVDQVLEEGVFDRLPAEIVPDPGEDRGALLRALLGIGGGEVVRASRFSRVRRPNVRATEPAVREARSRPTARDQAKTKRIRPATRRSAKSDRTNRPSTDSRRRRRCSLRRAVRLPPLQALDRGLRDLALPAAPPLSLCRRRIGTGSLLCLPVRLRGLLLRRAAHSVTMILPKTLRDSIRARAASMSVEADRRIDHRRSQPLAHLAERIA